MYDHNYVSPSEREKVMVKNYISAKDARTQTETTTKPLNVLFKQIKESAEWGMNYFNFGVFEHDPKVIVNITKALEDAGYTVSEDNDEEGKLISLKISW